MFSTIVTVWRFACSLMSGTWGTGMGKVTCIANIPQFVVIPIDYCTYIELPARLKPFLGNAIWVFNIHMDMSIHDGADDYILVHKSAGKQFDKLPA